MLTAVVVLVAILKFTTCQKPSPCPDKFKYEPKDPLSDTWYGIVTVKHTKNIIGLKIHIMLDHPAELLGTYYGTLEYVKSNKEMIITNSTYRLDAGQSDSIRFFVKYDLLRTVPSVYRIQLNYVTICLYQETLGKPPKQTTLRKPTMAPRPDFTKSNIVDFGTTSSTSRNFLPSSITNNRFEAIECGTIATIPNALIAHGENTRPGQWPWHVALYDTKDGSYLEYICGGILISENHVITAAHCVTQPRTTRPKDPQNIIINLGKYILKWFGSEIQQRGISEMYIHPDYNATSLFHDLAILEMSETVHITDYVRPCCLWEDDLRGNDVIGEVGTVVGWGIDEHGKIQDNLKKAEMPVVSLRTCLNSNRDFFGHFTYDKSYCAGFQNGTTVCNGDSGGGMVFPRRSTETGHTVWQLRGIVSIAVAATSGVCNLSDFVIFVDVAEYLEWINEIMANT